MYFARAEGQAELKRPPIVHVTYVEKVHPGEMIAASALCMLMVAGGALVVWRFGSRHEPVGG